MIKVKLDTYERLKDIKLSNRETYDHLLTRLLNKYERLF